MGIIADRLNHSTTSAAQVQYESNRQASDAWKAYRSLPAVTYHPGFIDNVANDVRGIVNDYAKGAVQAVSEWSKAQHQQTMAFGKLMNDTDADSSTFNNDLNNFGNSSRYGMDAGRLVMNGPLSVIPSIGVAGFAGNAIEKGIEEKNPLSTARSLTYGPAADFLSQPNLKENFYERPVSTLGEGALSMLPAVVGGKLVMSGGKHIGGMARNSDVLADVKSTVDKYTPNIPNISDSATRARSMYEPKFEEAPQDFSVGASHSFAEEPSVSSAPQTSGLEAGFDAWGGKRMDNGRNGCVEAVGKIGGFDSPFLAEESRKGVAYVPTLVRDAGDRVIPFDSSKLEKGDVIVYGDNDHVVLYDGKGGYYGNSSSKNMTVHGSNYREMGLTPTKIIKTGRGGAEASTPVDFTANNDEAAAITASNNEQVDAYGNKLNEEPTAEEWTTPKAEPIPKDDFLGDLKEEQPKTQMQEDVNRVVNGEDINKPADMADKEPWQMTSDEYRNSIMNSDTSMYSPVENTVDWGDPGKVKRVGGVVYGNPTIRGKVTYKDILGNLPEVKSGEDISELLPALDAGQQSAYLHARASGMDPKEAYKFAKSDEIPQVDPHMNAVKAAIEAGKNVPTEVLKEYPELVKTVNMQSDVQQAVDKSSISPERMQEMKEVDDYLSQLKGTRQRMIDEQVKHYKENPGDKGVDTAPIYDDALDPTGGRVSISNNPQWYQDAYEYFGRKPPKNRLAEFAEEDLKRNSEEFGRTDLQIRQLEEYRKRLAENPTINSDDIADGVFKEINYAKKQNNDYYDVAMDGDYKKAADMASQAGDEKAAKSFKLLAETNGGKKQLPPNLTGKPKGEYDGDTITMRKIVKRAQELFVPIRTGRLGRNDIDGFANHKTGVIRVGDYGNMKTMSHEIGHVVDAALDLRSDAGKYDSEFKRVVESRFGKGAYRPDEIRGEGIAEFMKDYFTNEESTKQNFPQYYDAFKKAIAKNEDVRGRVNELKSMTDKWYSQSPEARGRSSVSYASENKPSPMEHLKNAWHSFVEGVVDDKDALQRAQDSFNVLTGKVADTKNDVYKMARLSMNSAMARAQMMIEGGKSDLVSRSLNKIYGEVSGETFHTLKDILSSLDESVKGKYDDYLKKGGFDNWHEALDALLVARRSREIRMVKVEDAKSRLSDIVEKMFKEKEIISKLVSAKKKLDRELVTNEIKEKTKGINRSLAIHKAKLLELDEARKDAEYGVMQAKSYKTAVSMDDAEKIINNAPQELHDAAEKVFSYNRTVLHIMQKSGMISRDVYDLLTNKYKNYVPLARDFSDEAGIIQGFGMGGKGFANVAQAIKSLSETGSTRQVRSPLESMVQNTYKLLGMAERNKVGQIFADWAKTRGAGKLCEEVTGTAKQKDSTVSVWINGEKHVYQTSPEIYTAIMNLNKETSNIITTLLSPPAGLLRAGATLMPDFALKNIMRDSFGAVVFSRYGFRPVIDHVAGIFHMIKKDQLFHDYQSSGALMSTMVGLDRDFVQASLKGLYKKDSAYYWKKYNPVQVLRGFSEMLETATRLGEYGRAIGKGASMEDAALSARDVSLDFSKAGSAGRQINKVSAFFNAGIQEPARIFQAFKENPKGTALKTAMYITLPSIALWAMNHDQDWYKETPNWEKNIFWMFKAGDTIYRIPKPFGLGVLFGSLPERTLDWIIDNDPNGMKSWTESAKDAFAPNIFPTAIAPIIEWMTNYSMFRGRSIVPGRLQKVPNAQQYTTNTSELAKDIGKMLNLSPMQIDNLIQGYGAGMATQTLNAADAITGHREMQNPFKKAFTTDPMKSPQSVQDFYDKLEESEKEYNGAGGKSGAKGNTKYNYQLMSHANKVMQDLNKRERAATLAHDNALVDEINKKQLKAAQDALKLYR